MKVRFENVGTLPLSIDVENSHGEQIRHLISVGVAVEERDIDIAYLNQDKVLRQLVAPDGTVTLTETAEGYVASGAGGVLRVHVSRESDDLLTFASLVLQEPQGYRSQLESDSSTTSGLRWGVDFTQTPDEDCSYTITRTDGLITREEWQRTGGLLWRRIDYSYHPNGLVESITTTLYDVTGTTPIATQTVVYDYDAGVVIGASVTRS